MAFDSSWKTRTLGSSIGGDRSEQTSLRVAIVSTCAVSTPPKKYGGTELVLAELARNLEQLGHRPTVFATGDSNCVGARKSVFESPIWPPDPLSELRHASAAWREIAREDFDVVHVNDAQALAFTHWVDVPTVATVHHEYVDSLAKHYAAFPDVAFVAISRRQAELLPEVAVEAVIHHGLDTSAYPYGDGDGGYAAFLGRFARCKGVHLSIDAARRARLRIRLGGNAHEPDEEYFVSEVAPRLGPDAIDLGELDHLAKVALLRGASALLFPIQWEEPFGLVLIESMLVGTPVIAFRRGAAPEIVEDGVTGYLVDSVDEMTARLANVGALDRRKCRERAVDRWSSRRMAEEYAKLYFDRIADARAAHGHCVSRRGHGTAAAIRRYTASPRRPR